MKGSKESKERRRAHARQREESIAAPPALSEKKFKRTDLVITTLGIGALGYALFRFLFGISELPSLLFGVGIALGYVSLRTRRRR